MASRGWDGKLKTCTPVKCTVTSGTLSCPVKPDGVGSWGSTKAQKRFAKHRQDVGLSPFQRPTELLFDASSCSPAPPALSSASDCQIIGGYGVKAKIQCGADYTGYCATQVAADAMTRIQGEWAEGGGQVPQCQDSEDAAGMLESDASVVALDENQGDSSAFLQSEVNVAEPGTITVEDGNSIHAEL